MEIVYVYETNGEQLEETENDSYVFVLDAGKTAVRKQISTQPHSEDENTNLQTWGFSNTEDNYGNPANGYCISKADYNRLLSNLPATAKADMENNYNIDGTGTVGSEWGGSCYGMSTSTLRVNDKNDAVSDYALGSKIAKLNDVKAADEQFKNNGKDSVGKAESVINFYHYQQLLPEYQNVRSTFAGYTKKEQITAVANLAKAAQSTKKPAVVDLWWNDGDDILGHSINAIGYRELASNESLYATYPHCILTYDCSNPDKTGNNSVCNIYFDDEGNWTVPGWEITPANAHMICGSGNPSVVGPVDYKTGTYAPSADMPASVSYDGDDDAWELKWGDNEAEVDGTDLTENITNDDVVTVLPEATDQNDHEYRIYIPENNDYTIIGNMIDHTVRVDDRMIKVNAEQGGEATVKQNGEVSVEANEEGKIMIEIISDNDNDNAPSHVILSVDNADNLIGQITDDGLIVKGDDLSSLEIRSDNIKTTVHSEESAVLVVQNDDGTIRIFEDKNDDGVFDDPAIIESAGFSHATVPEQTYTGKAIVPDVLVYHENTLLKQNIDYTIKFTNNVNVGSNATYTITGKGNYSGKETDTFQIVEKDIGDEDVTASEIASKAYDKKAYKPVPAVTYNGKKLAANKDFTVAYYKNAACTGNAVTPLTAGKYYAKVTGIKNYKGQKIIPFDIAATGKIPVSKLTIAAIPATQYTGGQITPKLSVKNGKTPLTENTEYTVTYGANTEVGVGTVTITGKELYVGTRTVTFNITGIPIAKAAVTCAKETFIYDGTPKTPTVTSITYDRGKIDIPCCTEEAYNYNTPEAQKKIGCLISYQNDIEAGKATMVLKGIHQCTGTVIKTYNIAPYNMTTDTNHSIEVSLAHTEYPFAKGTTKPKPTVTFNGRTLKEGVDYTLSYTNNKAVNDGTKPRSVPTVKVTGKKNFTGEKTATFKIVAANMQDAGVKVVANDVVYADKNGNWKTTLNLVDEEGKTLKSNTDYDLKNAEYRLGNETGELLTNEHRLSTEDVVYVKVPAKGINYTGYAEGTYRISRQNIAKLNATIKPKTYTGKRVTLTNTDIVWKGVSDQADVTYIIDETSYKNNTDKGKATVDVIGTGDFCGRKTITFTIGPKGILWWWNDLKN
ncbi:MAG: hypothetical protein J5518_04405 [Lachnospiraceae bacterium]|nr:hypothetical protein [Lachnospiraceae bacterium]